MNEPELISESNLIPSDEELDEVERRFADPLLTDDEVHALTNQEDKGIKPIPTHQFKDENDFTRSLHGGNFVSRFRPTGMNLNIIRRQKSFQRFVILEPDLTKRLIDSFQGEPEHHFTDQDVQDLFRAYQVMSYLIDVHDRYALNSKGQPNQGLLLGHTDD